MTTIRRTPPRPHPATVPALPHLLKAPTGIAGLDEITGGGFPRGRPTLVCGAAGCGKTLLAMEFLVRGVVQFDEPGVFLAFEETAGELATNVASLGFDVPRLVRRRQLAIDHVRVVPGDLAAAGEFDLDGLFVRLGYAIDRVKAKRVVLDTIECLFGGLPDPARVRAELQRLFGWLKARGQTVIITGERGEQTLTRHGLEEYVSDCVILLEHRVREQVSTRILRIVKYRGSLHGTNEYPFLVERHGISVIPLSELRLVHAAPTRRQSSGLPQLDRMLGGGGYYRGSSVLISGAAGTGKTTLALQTARATCAGGRRSLVFTFEESPEQILRNMLSVGLDLRRPVREGRLRLVATRPSSSGLEAHLRQMRREVEAFDPAVVIVDPLNAFVAAGNSAEVKSLLMRLIDFLKDRGATAVLTSLTAAGSPEQGTDTDVSSLIDTWLVVRDLEADGERNRGLFVIKSRGMAHSNQVREFVITSRGIELREAYVGPGGVAVGSARLAQEARDRAARYERDGEIAALRAELASRRRANQSQAAALRAAFDADAAELRRRIERLERREADVEAARVAQEWSRRSTGTRERRRT
jgi:circadian clock protein KaiC